MKRKYKIALAAVSLPLVYVAGVFGSTSYIHGAANKTIEPIAARNISVYAQAPVFAEARQTQSISNWAEQQRKIGFRLLAGGVMIDWAVTSAFNNSGSKYGDLLNRHDIALLPELDKAAKPGLIVDGTSGCINLMPPAQALVSMKHASGLLNAFAKQGYKHGSYTYVGEGHDSAIVHIPLPPHKTAKALCTEVRPVHHHVHQHTHG